jgi:hypothetical protein
MVFNMLSADIDAALADPDYDVDKYNIETSS